MAPLLPRHPIAITSIGPPPNWVMRKSDFKYQWLLLLKQSLQNLNSVAKHCTRHCVEVTKSQRNTSQCLALIRKGSQTWWVRIQFVYRFPFMPQIRWRFHCIRVTPFFLRWTGWTRSWWPREWEFTILVWVLAWKHVNYNRLFLKRPLIQTKGKNTETSQGSERWHVNKSRISSSGVSSLSWRGPFIVDMADMEKLHYRNMVWFLERKKHPGWNQTTTTGADSPNAGSLVC